MRSIRRSLLGYLLVLLALSLGAVAALVDRFAHAAIRSREESESGRIEQAYQLREQEARGRAADARRKFEADLLAEAKTLSKEVQYKLAVILAQNPERRLTAAESTALQIGAAVLGQPLAGRGGGGVRPSFFDPPPPVRAAEDEARAFRLRVGLTEFGSGAHPLAAVLTAAAAEPRVPNPFPKGPVEASFYNDPRRYNPYPLWTEYDGPRVLARVADALAKTLEDDDHPPGFQVTLAGGPVGRPPQVLVPHPATVGGHKVELPLPADWLAADAEAEPQLDALAVGGHELRRVVSASSPNGRLMSFPVWVPGPPPLVPSAGAPFRPNPRGAHLSVRAFVQLARAPLAVDDGLPAALAERDAHLARVRTEARAELARLRGRLIAIGAATFAALVLGGWFFVARGLAPLHTLSDAVSRVSERDFRLPVGAAELGRELAPIHARITQTLTLLQRAFAREKQAVADISHELRTPIASLLATIDVTLRKPRTPEQYRTALEECRLISKQLGQLVERIMTLASLDAGNDHTHAARTDGGELAAGCAAVIRPLAAANNLSLAVGADEGVVLDTDPGKLREVLMNLLHNAVEYNRPDGAIELSVRREGGRAVFEVRDTGIGMTPEVRDRIFERFYRADSSRHATGVHAGLGLAIVKEYVARLNGTITVESAPGAGTTFRVELPAVAEVGSNDRAKARGALPAAS